MDKKLAYYAHPQNLYGTPQEKRDVEAIEALGFTVINPSDAVHVAHVNELKAGNAGGFAIMAYFFSLVRGSSAVFFRAFPDGRIGAGVHGEIGAAVTQGIQVYELPSGIGRRALTVEQTRETLKELGQR